MSYFQQDIVTVMNADASLNNLVDYIFPKRMDKDTNENQNTILVYDFDMEDSDEDRTSNSVFQKWKVEVYIGGINYDKVYKAVDRLLEYLKAYRGTNIDKFFNPYTSEEFDDEDEIYTVRTYFDVIYQD